MKNLTKATLIALTLVVPFGIAQAGHHGEKDGHHGKGQHQRGHHGDIKKMLRGLDLTEAQKTEVRALVEQAKANRPAQPSEAEREAMHAQMQAFMAQPEFNDAEAKALIEQKQARQFDSQLARLKLHHEVMQVLSDEQKAKLEQKRAEHRAKRAEHHAK